MPDPRPNEEQPPTERPAPPFPEAALPPLAALVTFFLPGLGYLLFKDLPRTLRVALPIHALIVLGLLIGGVSVIDSQRERWWFILQAPAGGPVFLVNTIHQRFLKGTDFGSVRLPPLNERVVTDHERERVIEWVGDNNAEGRLPRLNERVVTDHEGERVIEWVGDNNAEGRLQGVDAFAKPREIGSLCIAIAGMLNAIVIVDCLSGGKRGVVGRRRRATEEGVGQP